MNWIPTIVLIFLTLSATSLAFWPLIGTRRKNIWRSSIDELDSLLQEKEMILMNLRDLDQDLQVDKVNRLEYEELKADLLEKAASIYAAIENLELKDPLITQIEADLRA